MSGETPDLNVILDRLRRLEVKHRTLRSVCVVLAIATAAVPLLLTRALDTTVGTNAVVVPTGPGHVKGGLAVSKDGKEILLWLAHTTRGDQTRLKLADDGSQFLTFFDRQGRARARFGLGADSVPRLELLADDGRVLWSATPGPPPG